MSGPGEEWNEAAAVQSWDNAIGRAAIRRAEQGTAGERAGAAYSEPAGRPRQRGVRRVRRDTSMDAAVVERVEQFAQQQHGGNYSAALQAVVEAGLATMDAAVRMHAASVELEQLTRPEHEPLCSSCRARWVPESGVVEHEDDCPSLAAMRRGAEPCQAAVTGFCGCGDH